MKRGSKDYAIGELNYCGEKMSKRINTLIANDSTPRPSNREYNIRKTYESRMKRGKTS